jgi:hypothetical protein
VSKVKGTQSVFQGVNELLFPNAKTLPSIPDELFKAEMLSTQTVNERPLRVLSLGKFR